MVGTYLAEERNLGVGKTAGLRSLGVGRGVEDGERGEEKKEWGSKLEGGGGESGRLD